MVEMFKGRSPIIGNSSVCVMETIVNNFGLPPAKMLINLRSRQECDDKRLGVEWDAFVCVRDDGKVDSWFLEEETSRVFDRIPDCLQSVLKQMFQYTNRPSAQQCTELFKSLQ